MGTLLLVALKLMHLSTVIIYCKVIAGMFYVFCAGSGFDLSTADEQRRYLSFSAVMTVINQVIVCRLAKPR